MTDTVVVEGQVRLREGKKWKSRWVALRKPSPVADCLCVLVYKERSKGKERSQLTLGDICGLELLQNFEGVNYALTLLCLTQSVTLGFDSRENLLAWDARIRYSLGEVHRFSVNVQPGTKLESGAASLHLCNNLIGIARDIPPVVLAHWKLTDLRRYGAVPNGFIFEGGTRCGYWTGVFFLACTEGEQISFLFDCIARGSSPSRTPFGLRPSLPDLSAHASSVEERITQEASELEKRLSMLSVCSHQSTASHSGSTGDTRSISSSSSEASHSDASLSSRLATWADPVRYPTPTEPSVSVSGATGSRSFSEEHHEGLLRTQSKPPRPRGLQEAGRQSSTDSGIATGSHSSYSGSFSSYTGSLDTAQGEAEEFGSVMSLTLTTNSSTNQTVSNTPTSTSNTNPRVPLQFQTSSILASTSTLIPGYRPCVCPISGVSQAQDLEYQVPVQLLQHYDTPRKLVQPHSSTSSSTQKAQCGLLEPLGSPASPTLNAPLRPSGSGDGVLPSGGLTMQRHILCPVCGGLKMVMPSTHIRSSHVPAGLEKNRPETSSAAVSAAPQGASADSSTEAELLSRYELISGQGSQKCLWEAEGRSSAVPTSPMSSLRLFRHSSLSDPRRSNDYMASPMEPFRNQSDLELCLTLSFGRSLALPGESGFTVTERLHGEPVNYVNIPVSPVSKRQLNYMELDLQDVQETGHTVRGVSNTKYAQIDHAATETAQRVGAQHAQGREERLHELEQRRRGTLN